MKPLNWETILGDIREAREELERIEREALSDESLSEGAFQVSLRHAYFHLNFAWNARHETSERYASLTDEDFEKWGKYPKEIEDL